MAFRGLFKRVKPNLRINSIHRRQIFRSLGTNSLDVISFTDRTHTCGTLRSDDVGRQVKLCGWVQHVRMNQFIVLRDWQGVIQLMVPKEKSDLLEKTKDLSYETVIEVCGTVKPRAQGQENLILAQCLFSVGRILEDLLGKMKLETGAVEIEVEDLNVLNPAIPQLPFSVADYQKINEPLRMQYRYLDIRTKQMQRNLRLRSKFIMKMREFLVNKHGFVDVETPTLFRKTPGGAKEFVVPCQHKGKFFTLPQSPQQFKQLLMVGGIDRYFQIARCYRDEGAKPDRQPEFTQLDLEMSFVRRDGVLSLIEDLMVHSWPEDVSQITSPFPHMTYEQAMRLYGTDKPDTRFNMQLTDITDLQSVLGLPLEEESDSVIALRIPEGQNYFSNKEIVRTCVGIFQQISNVDPPDIYVLKFAESLLWWGQTLKRGKFLQLTINEELQEKIKSRLQAGPRDTICWCVKKNANTNQFSAHEYLGRLRLKCADHIENEKGVKLRDKNQFNFLWVEDFPLFLPKEDGSEGLESAHHPFTDVHPDDRHMFYTDPSKVRGQHYDLVVNGNEVGGGSIRIHDTKDQEYVIQHVLKEDSSQLKHLLEAFTMGCPPHGGIALGLDRLLAVICGSPSIRDVIAFPKGHEGKDPMSGAPTEISQADLDLYHIQVKESE